jgi:hypothetical protein
LRRASAIAASRAWSSVFDGSETRNAMFPTSVAPAATSRNVPSWEYGKPLKQPLLPAYLCRRTHEDSAQLTNLRYRHHSGLYVSENEDGSRCQRPELCSHRWMTNTRSVRWMRWERPVSPRLQRRATIDPLSILCPSRGGSTSPERHLDSSFPLQLEPGRQAAALVSWSPPCCIRRVVAGPGVLTELTLRRYHRYWFAARARLAGSRVAGVGSPPLVAEPLAMAAQYAGRSSDSALCNLRRAADRSVAKVCWPGAVAAFPA